MTDPTAARSPSRVTARIRRHLTYANVAATLALVLASGGTAYAVNTVRSADIVDGAVRSVDLANNDVRSVDIKNGGVSLVDIAPAARATLTAGSVLALTDLDGLPCVVDAQPGTVDVQLALAVAGVAEVELTCAADPP